MPDGSKVGSISLSPASGLADAVRFRQMDLMRFDVVISFDISPRDGLNILYEEINRAYPDYDIFILPDVDVSD